MKELDWKEEYSLAIPAIDLQHKRIFDCIKTIAGGSTKDDGLLAEFAVVKLLGLLQEHFALEESMMRTLSYPELDRHILEHREFQADVHEIAQKHLRTKQKISREAIKSAQRWMRDHILTSDKHYFDFFASAAHKSAVKKRAAK